MFLRKTVRLSKYGVGKKKKKQVTKSRASLLRPFSDVQLDIGATFVYFREKKKK